MAHVHYPRVEIGFCTKCKWNFRATWYLQELLSTFDGQLGEVSLVPQTGGIFYVKLVANSKTPAVVLWDRKIQGGFPDSKELKRLVRDVIDPTRDLGHVDRGSGPKRDRDVQEKEKEKEKKEQETEPIEECKDCLADR